MTEKREMNWSNDGSTGDGFIMYKRMCDLFPINRSITGDGVRETLKYIKKILPNLKLHKARTGKKVFDWTIPDEWNLIEGYIADKHGNKIIDAKNNNLHIVGYSDEVDKWITKEELNSYLHTLPDDPDAIPYVTSYYSSKWGFCLTENQRLKMVEDMYYVKINATKEKGFLNYADLVIRGKSKKEVLISTYICHPSMANNELSGPMVATRLAEILSKQNNHFTYRFIFIPETIGSIVYLSKNLSRLKKRTVAGYVLTCIGDENSYSFLGSKYKNTLSDKTAMSVISEKYIEAKLYNWEDRGSDERQYCSPGVDLPIASLMRSKYGEYNEYHTSKDDLNFVSCQGLQGGLNYAHSIISRIEKNCIPVTKIKGEPQLGKRDLYSNVSKKGSYDAEILCNLLSYSDGSNDLIDIAGFTGHTFEQLYTAFKVLKEAKLVQDARERTWRSTVYDRVKRLIA